jgi:hypothetical protein
MFCHCSWVYKVTFILYRKNFKLHACKTTSFLASLFQQPPLRSQSPQFFKPKEHAGFLSLSTFLPLCIELFSSYFCRVQAMPQVHSYHSELPQPPGPRDSSTQHVLHQYISSWKPRIRGKRSLGNL